jgi:hypothetical protein
VRSWQLEPASARNTLGEVKGFITVTRSSSGKQIQLISCFPRSLSLTWVRGRGNRLGKKSRQHAGWRVPGPALYHRHPPGAPMLTRRCSNRERISGVSRLTAN